MKPAEIIAAALIVIPCVAALAICLLWLAQERRDAEARKEARDARQDARQIELNIGTDTGKD